MEGHCSTGQSPQWAVVPMQEEEGYIYIYYTEQCIDLGKKTNLMQYLSSVYFVS